MKDYKELIKNLQTEDFTQGIVNLHIHTNHSDGAADFDNIIEQALNKGFKYISITDHNTMSGYENSKYLNSNILIPGVEFDVWVGYVYIHLLAYGIDSNHADLKPFFAKSKKETESNILRILPTRNIKKLINAIHNAGGIAVLAHPACCWAISLEHLIEKLIKLGLDGIETYYPYPRFRKFVKFHRAKSVLKLADKYKLIKTGGTDLHATKF